MEYSQDMKNRMKRIEGQVRGVVRMMEEDKECQSIITQMSAIRSAVDKATAFVVAKNLEVCLRDQSGSEDDREETIEEAVKMLVKSR